MIDHSQRAPSSASLRSRRSSRGLLGSLAVGIVLCSAGTARADDGDDDVLRPSSRPMFATFGVGPSIGITGCNNSGCSTNASFTQFKLTQDFGYHFMGEGEGPALGVNVEEAFGDNVFRLQPGVKLWWDFQPSEDLGLYVAPTVKLGYGLVTATQGSYTAHAFNWQVGAALRMVLGDRGMVFVRPITLDSFVNDDGIAFSWDIVAGGGLTF